MQVPYRVEEDFARQVGPYETRVALTDERDVSPIAIVLFKEFDEAGVPRACQTIFLAPHVVDQIGDMIAKLNEPAAAEVAIQTSE